MLQITELAWWATGTQEFECTFATQDRCVFSARACDYPNTPPWAFQVLNAAVNLEQNLNNIYVGRPQLSLPTSKMCI